MATWSQTSKTQQNEPKAKPTNTTTTPKPDNIHMDKMKHKRTSLNNKTTLKYQNKQDNNKKKQGKKHTATNTTPNVIKKRELHTKLTQRNNKRKHLIIITSTRSPKPDGHDHKNNKKKLRTQKNFLSIFTGREEFHPGVTFARFCCCCCS